VQHFVPADRPDEDPFEKERMRRSMLIRRFLVFMRDIKLQQFNKNVECKWPPGLPGGSKAPPPEEEDWKTWKGKVLPFSCAQSSVAVLIRHLRGTAIVEPFRFSESFILFPLNSILFKKKFRSEEHTSECAESESVAPLYCLCNASHVLGPAWILPNRHVLA
jgi:hypothetical protein